MSSIYEWKSDLKDLLRTFIREKHMTGFKYKNQARELERTSILLFVPFGTHIIILIPPRTALTAALNALFFRRHCTHFPLRLHDFVRCIQAAVQSPGICTRMVIKSV